MYPHKGGDDLMGIPVSNPLPLRPPHGKPKNPGVPSLVQTRPVVSTMSTFVSFTCVMYCVTVDRRRHATVPWYTEKMYRKYYIRSSDPGFLIIFVFPGLSPFNLNFQTLGEVYTFLTVLRSRVRTGLQHPGKLLKDPLVRVPG